jgi:signal transduction histidine kinase
MPKTTTELFAAAIDDDGAGGFLARVLNDVTPVLLRNGRLRVRQIGHQLLIAHAPAGLGHGCKRLLHAAAESQTDNYEYNCTHRLLVK